MFEHWSQSWVASHTDLSKAWKGHGTSAAREPVVSRQDNQDEDTAQALSTQPCVWLGLATWAHVLRHQLPLSLQACQPPAQTVSPRINMRPKGHIALLACLLCVWKNLEISHKNRFGFSLLRRSKDLVI